MNVKNYLLCFLLLLSQAKGMEKEVSCDAPKVKLFHILKNDNLPASNIDDKVEESYETVKSFLKEKGYEELGSFSKFNNATQSFFINKKQKPMKSIYLEVQYHPKRKTPVFHSSLESLNDSFSLLAKRIVSKVSVNSSWGKIEAKLYSMTGGRKSFSDFYNPYGNNLKKLFTQIEKEGLEVTINRLMVVSNSSKNLLFYYLYETKDEKDKLNTLIKNMEI